MEKVSSNISNPTREVIGKTMEQQYWMTLSLNILNHLGINLYSSVPAVLSEVVANAWDADAKIVDIWIDEDNKEISITDDIRSPYLAGKAPAMNSASRIIRGFSILIAPPCVSAEPK